MQSTLTLTDSVNNAALTFNFRLTDTNGLHTWSTSDQQSPDMELVLTRQSQRTKSGVLSRAFKLTMPYTGADGKKASIQARVVLNAPMAADIDDCKVVLSMLADALASTNADLVGFRDDYLRGY